MDNLNKAFWVGLVCGSAILLGFVIRWAVAGPGDAISAAMIGAIGGIGGATVGQYLAGENSRAQLAEQFERQKSENRRDEIAKVYEETLSLFASHASILPEIAGTSSRDECVKALEQLKDRIIGPRGELVLARSNLYAPKRIRDLGDEISKIYIQIFSQIEKNLKEEQFNLDHIQQPFLDALPLFIEKLDRLSQEMRKDLGIEES